MYIDTRANHRWNEMRVLSTVACSSVQWTQWFGQFSAITTWETLQRITECMQKYSMMAWLMSWRGWTWRLHRKHHTKNYEPAVIAKRRKNSLMKSMAWWKKPRLSLTRTSLSRCLSSGHAGSASKGEALKLCFPAKCSTSRQQREAKFSGRKMPKMRATMCFLIALGFKGVFGFSYVCLPNCGRHHLMQPFQHTLHRHHQSRPTLKLRGRVSLKSSRRAMHRTSGSTLTWGMTSKKISSFHTKSKWLCIACTWMAAALWSSMIYIHSCTAACILSMRIFSLRAACRVCMRWFQARRPHARVRYAAGRRNIPPQCYFHVTIPSLHAQAACIGFLILFFFTFHDSTGVVGEVVVKRTLHRGLYLYTHIHIHAHTKTQA